MYDEFENSFDARDLELESERYEEMADLQEDMGDFDAEMDCPEYEDDGQPSEYQEWQDYMGGDDWDNGQFDHYDGDY